MPIGGESKYREDVGICEHGTKWRAIPPPDAHRSRRKGAWTVERGAALMAHTHRPGHHIREPSLERGVDPAHLAAVRTDEHAPRLGPSRSGELLQTDRIACERLRIDRH